jgi:hypothetical protein
MSALGPKADALPFVELVRFGGVDRWAREESLQTSKPTNRLGLSQALTSVSVAELVRFVPGFRSASKGIGRQG